MPPSGDHMCKHKCHMSLLQAHPVLPEVSRDTGMTWEATKMSREAIHSLHLEAYSGWLAGPTAFPLTQDICLHNLLAKGKTPVSLK